MDAHKRLGTHVEVLVSLSLEYPDTSDHTLLSCHLFNHLWACTIPPQPLAFSSHTAQDEPPAD
jgi:hypothetical protein